MLSRGSVAGEDSLLGALLVASQFWFSSACASLTSGMDEVYVLMGTLCFLFQCVTTV